MNLAWWLESAAWEYPQKVAVIDATTGEQLTYEQLNSLSNKIGNMFKDRWGITEDDVVATLLPDNYWHMGIMYGLFKTGAVFCGLNRTQNLDKFLYDLSKSGAKGLIVNADYLEIARQLKKEKPELQVMYCDKDDCELLNLRELIEEGSEKIRMISRSSRDLAAINFTAGTTGAPKGVMFTHGTLGTSILGSIFWGGIKSKDVIVAPISLFHSGGISDAVRSVAAKATLIWMGGWDADKAIRIIEKYKPSWFHFIVPTMIRDMAKREKFKTLDMSGMKANIAGEPVPPDVQELLDQKGMQTINFYGMTETMPCIVTMTSMYYEDYNNNVRGSSGKPNKEFGEVKLVDPIDGKVIVEPRIKGEICFRGDVLTPGYFNDLERSKAAFDEEGWFHTNDLGWFDEQGYYYVEGRTDDMILSGGEKLSLLEVENVILKHPLVKDVACIGVPHARYGESPAAFIVPVNDIGEEELKEQVEEYVLQNMEKWKRPRLYIKCDQIPRTAAKRTKDQAKLKEAVNGIKLGYEVSSTTFSSLAKLFKPS